MVVIIKAGIMNSYFLSYCRPLSAHETLVLALHRVYIEFQSVIFATTACVTRVTGMTLRPPIFENTRAGSKWQSEELLIFRPGITEYEKCTLRSAANYL